MEYIAHHGIKGQKWGVRRFQNPDGTLTAAGKKRYYYSNGQLSARGAKQLKNLTKEMANSQTDDKRKESGKKVVQFLNESHINSTKIEKLRSLERKLNEASNNTLNDVDYFDTEERINDSRKAYDDTYKWFQKNDNEYLQSILKLNNGDKADLDMYHDFRKVFEGFEEDAWTKGEKKYYSEHPEILKREKEYDKALKEYNDYLRDLTNEIVSFQESVYRVDEPAYGNYTKIGEKYIVTTHDLIKTALRDNIR